MLSSRIRTALRSRSVYATSGEREAAYEVFVEIYGVNSHYRDVVARLEELRGD